MRRLLLATVLAATLAACSHNQPEPAAKLTPGTGIAIEAGAVAGIMIGTGQIPARP